MILSVSMLNELKTAKRLSEHLKHDKQAVVLAFIVFVLFCFELTPGGCVNF